MKKILTTSMLVCLITCFLFGCSIAESQASVREKMSNFQGIGYYNIYDGWVYSLNFPKNGGNAHLSKMRKDGSDYTVLANGSPRFISIDGEYIYFILNNTSNKITTRNIYRCRLGGSGLTQVIEGDAWFLQVTEEYLYYNKYESDAQLSLGVYRAYKDGSNEELILDKNVISSYVVGEDIYYTDLEDGTIHKYNITSKTDEKITSDVGFSFVLDGECGYYLKATETDAGDITFALTKTDLKTKEENSLYEYNGSAISGIAVSDTVIYFINGNDENRIYSIKKDGSSIKLISQDSNCDNLAIFGNNLMYIDYDDKGNTEAIYFCEEDGSNKVDIMN